MLLSVFLPLFNFLLISLFGRFIGKTGTVYITLYSILLVTCLNVNLFYQALVVGNFQYTVYLGPWIEFIFSYLESGLESFGVADWEFVFDSLAVSILAIVSIVSTLVHIYSFSYIKTDPHFNRFISYLSLFTFFIFILVTAANFVQLFVGWEGVGICSYLLINFWYTRIQAGKAAIKAILINRIGDIGFLIAIALIYATFRTLDFDAIKIIVNQFSRISPIYSMWDEFGNTFAINILDSICFFLLVGVAGKSAQIGLHTWLPSAIEGPTPVSALIHAATIVTAGIFLVIRTSFLFECSDSIRSLILILGTVTALLSALTAVFLYDIKRIIAYSTCSQLGYILLACGLSQYSIGFFHLINHAFFKALLFLTAGAIIHSYNNEQDIRKLTGVFTRMPFIYAAILIGNIAIIGLPFLSGFYSKDLIIEITYLNASGTFGIIDINIIFIFIMLATLCTAIYSIRMYYYLFLRQGVVHKDDLRAEGFVQPFFIQIALGLLILGSIFSGYLLSDIFSTTNQFFYHLNTRWFASDLVHHTFFENEFLPWYIKLAPIFCNLAVIGLTILFVFLYNNGTIPQYVDIVLAHISPTFNQTFKKQYKLANFYLYISRDFNQRAGYWLKIAQNNFYFNEVYNYLALANFHYYYQGIFLNLDKGIFELIGPTGLSRIYIYVTKKFTYWYEQGLARQLFLIYNTILAYLFIVEYFI